MEKGKESQSLLILNLRLFYDAESLNKRLSCRPLMPFLPKDLSQDELEEMFDERHLMGGPAHAIYTVGADYPPILTSRPT